MQRAKAGTTLVMSCDQISFLLPRSHHEVLLKRPTVYTLRFGMKSLDYDAAVIIHPFVAFTYLAHLAVASKLPEEKDHLRFYQRDTHEHACVSFVSAVLCSGSLVSLLEAPTTFATRAASNWAVIMWIGTRYTRYRLSNF
ncbi:hypothetical protein F5B22DRAFT_607020 [Xylaria bambusicola]|uniref:uncharacterized protein n=1 Tax=Xylaria bambusicola TaxID=326684 RepID=UPI0020088475|nr:uncharacterized protein F5B22DRAFT_607020 [Xylaria bambusicola]KAI0515367.1 hypothetical protein F5B22DRAFT_607020 [Xylaria bambusicola]